MFSSTIRVDFCFHSIEIHQQILESQLVQNANHNFDGRTDHDMQRTRSSITRTMLLNTGELRNEMNNFDDGFYL